MLAQPAPATVGGSPPATNRPNNPADRTPVDTPEPAIPLRPADAGPVNGDADEMELAPAPPTIPGYRIDRTLGVGGMGTVYLARQLSLDRPVALKVMSPKWAADPLFVARFTREAYAAALLNHPNVVQVYDVGEVDGARYFSMEYVPGRSLADVLKAETKLDAERAVGYVLQAARGLKHAHDRGMVHRDVKPDNLLLDNQEIIKVADLGLVKTPDLHRADDRPTGADTGPGTSPDITGARMALGTPAYMAPEQCRDAATVDWRADIYALGCTLYVLLTGKTPFDGNTDVEVMTKHAYEPLVPPEAIVGRVPQELSVILQKMMAKNPDDRYPHMGEVIRTLERWLGIHPTGTFSPRDDQIDRLEQAVTAFNDAPAVVLRGRAVSAVVTTCVVAAVLLAFFDRLGWAFGLAGMVVQSAVAYFALNGYAGRTYAFRRARQFLLGLAAWDCVIAATAVGLVLFLLAMSNLFWVWVGFGVIGTALAVLHRLVLDRAVQVQRREPLHAIDRLLRQMRLGGIGEEEIRNFVAKYAGRRWEEVFEVLFGYEAKLAARSLLLRGGAAGVREKFAAWREPLLQLIDRIEAARQEARQRRLFERIELARLAAAGEPLPATLAAAAAAALVREAGVIRAAEAGHPTAGPRSLTAPDLGHLIAPDPNRARFARRFAPPREPEGWASFLLVGVPVRAVLAAVLLAGFAVWVYQNQFFAGPRSPFITRALAIDGLPPVITAWCGTVNAGWAGVLLFASLFFRGYRTGLFVLLGAAVTALGHQLGIRTLDPVRDHHVALMLGTIFALIGYRMGRR
jgi:hypothetical protein